jgi:thioredoxin reductase (NADPH)
MDAHKLVIIGGGAAGYTAAIYAARANLHPLCIEGYVAGGVLMTTGVVENYPGFAEGITGPELMLVLREQAERFGTRFIAKDVTAIDLSTWPFRLSLVGMDIEAEAVIVSTGATAKRLGLASEEALDGYGVAYCVACDGPFFAGKRVAVIGGGDSAMDQAMSLARIAREVVLIHRREDFRATEIMIQYARAHENISFLTPFTVEEILGVEEQRVTGVRLRDAVSGDTRIEHLDGAFVSIGHDPATELFTPFLDHDQYGYLSVAPGSTMTSVEGVFASGDVHDRVYRQVVTAAGFGSMAAIDAERWLAHRGSSTNGRGAHTGPAAEPILASRS